MTMLLAAPALLLIAVVFGWPMLRYAWLSFHADSVLTGLEPVANGGANWLRLVADQRFWLDAGQTARFALISVGLELLLALAIALLLPYILLSLLFRLAQAFGVFDLVQVLTGGGPAGSTESIALYAYLNGMRFLDFGYSATVMLAGFLLLTALILAGTLLLRSFGLLSSLDR